MTAFKYYLGLDMEHLYPGLPLMGKILLEQAECHS